MRFAAAATTCLVQAALSLIFSSNSANAVSIERRATTCNGHAELCDRSFGNVTFVGAHNSYAVGTNNLATNQDYDVTRQLNDGVRMLQVQIHNNEGVVSLCHTSCFLYNGGPLVDYLRKVKTWMDANPNDVVSLVIVNSDRIEPAQYGEIFASAGLDTLSYSPPTATLGASDWPTLGSLIDAGHRLVTFMDSRADFAVVPYIINEFTNVWETKFNVIEPTFDCDVNRTQGDTASQLYLINHFLDHIVLGQPVPDKAALNTTNGEEGPGSLGAHVDTCAAQHGKNPNFLLVDFYEYGAGSVFRVAAEANGVTYAPTSPIATPIPDSDDSGSSAASGGAGGTSSALCVSGTYSMAILAVVGGIFFGGISF